jgi:hypothetical protein
MSLHTKSIQQLNTSFSSKTQFFLKKFTISLRTKVIRQELQFS